MTDRPTPDPSRNGLPAYRPAQRAKLPPCQEACLVSGDVRGWLGIVAQRVQMGLDEPEAYRRAWHKIVDVNPFPAVLGRICPHPCQVACNRNDKDAPVAINALERFLGDWAIEHDLMLAIDDSGTTSSSVGVIGSGPSGLSFAYQMARRGHAVTVYEKELEPGGMLRRGVPDYRLPPIILDAEIGRILELPVALELGVNIGRDISMEELRRRHDALYVAIGAQIGRPIGIPGELGPGVWTGVDYLHRVNTGEAVEMGRKVAVIGGGNTAIDAARTARRSGAAVTVLYRRTRAEMPAAEDEIDEALQEGVTVEYLVSPVEILRSGKQVTSIVVDRMRLGEPDESGRRRPIPVDGSRHEMDVDTVISAIAQLVDWGNIARPSRLGTVREVADGIWLGGDAANPGLAGEAVAHGRLAADGVHATLTGRPLDHCPPKPSVRSDRIKLDHRPVTLPVEVRRIEMADALAEPQREVRVGISEADFLSEVARCFSCGLCYGCAHCAMYCTVGSFTTLASPSAGAYYAMDLERCLECGKCIEVCPSGFLEPVIDPATWRGDWSGRADGAAAGGKPLVAPAT